jgi:hypothetical protein
VWIASAHGLREIIGCGSHFGKGMPVDLPSPTALWCGPHGHLAAMTGSGAWDAGDAAGQAMSRR